MKKMGDSSENGALIQINRLLNGGMTICSSALTSAFVFILLFRCLSFCNLQKGPEWHLSVLILLILKVCPDVSIRDAPVELST